MPSDERLRQTDLIRLANALLWGQMSRDPKWKVGAILVHEDGRQVSMGFNGLIKGLEETSDNWQLPKKEVFVKHAEVNALSWARFSTLNSTLYCSLKPCTQCLGLAINAGVSRIVYMEYRSDMSANDKHYEGWDCLVNLIMIDKYSHKDVFDWLF